MPDVNSPSRSDTRSSPPSYIPTTSDPEFNHFITLHHTKDSLDLIELIQFYQLFLTLYPNQHSLPSHSRGSCFIYGVGPTLEAQIQSIFPRQNIATWELWKLYGISRCILNGSLGTLCQHHPSIVDQNLSLTLSIPPNMFPTSDTDLSLLTPPAGPTTSALAHFASMTLDVPTQCSSVPSAEPEAAPVAVPSSPSMEIIFMPDCIPEPTQSNPKAPTDCLRHEITSTELIEEDPHSIIAPSSIQPSSFPPVNFVTTISETDIGESSENLVKSPEIPRDAPESIHAIPSESPPSFDTDFDPDSPATSSAAPQIVPPDLLEEQTFALLAFSTPSHHPSAHTIPTPKPIPTLIPSNIAPSVQNLRFELPDPIIERRDRRSSILSDPDVSHVASNVQSDEDQPRIVENVQDVARQQPNASPKAERITFVTRDIGPRLSTLSDFSSPAFVSNTVHDRGDSLAQSSTLSTHQHDISITPSRRKKKKTRRQNESTPPIASILNRKLVSKLVIMFIQLVLVQIAFSPLLSSRQDSSRLARASSEEIKSISPVLSPRFLYESPKFAKSNHLDITPSHPESIDISHQPSIHHSNPFVDSSSSAYPMLNITAAIPIPSTISLSSSRYLDQISEMLFPRVHPTTQVISRKHVRFKIHPSVFHKSTPNHTSLPPYLANIRNHVVQPHLKSRQYSVDSLPSPHDIQSPSVVKASSS
ncbi:hypothetical protein SISSUDRAFT_1061229 [Sistotremastrum suecicum HHB10207 ss-3]|uniref:Uncharacterized protein n=1 Tax=Sistotremastrum suecicum HHB10207 ss-3 TaxID=1314776 RepID=A0A166E7Q7_9AGAM|nr:hypothetical protein SISSUDRAFT_1061229 [Sistotremastrum suecicum HHB10207 ss-3]